MRNSILLLIASFSVATFAGQERGGGTENERDFVKMAKFGMALIESDRKSGSRLFDGFNMSAYADALDRVEVYELPKVCEPDTIDLTTGGTNWGRCFEAQYIEKQKRIEFDVNIWKGKTCLERVALAVHEYGRASKNENGNYKFSSLIDRANTSHVDNICLGPDPRKKAPVVLGFVNKCRRNPIDGSGPFTSIFMSLIDLSGREITQFSSLDVPVGSVQEAVTMQYCEGSYNRLLAQGYRPVETLLLRK